MEKIRVPGLSETTREARLWALKWQTFSSARSGFRRRAARPLRRHARQGDVEDGRGDHRSAHDADAVIGVVSIQPFNRRLLTALSRCRVIAGIGIGYDKTDLEAATELGIAVTNVPDYCLDEVSGLAITYMLALGHRLLQIDRAVRERRIAFTMDKKALDEIACPMFRMRDQTLGIVGLGKIGTVTALKARGLGMRVIAYDPYVLRPVMESRGVKPVDFDTLLRESDFVTIHTPLTSETRNMFGYEQFKKMKRTAYFINTARGGCVDQGGPDHRP